MQIYSVGEVSQYLRGLLSADPILADIWISGEISNLTRSTAGHAYWTLKDGAGQLKCVLFKREAAGQTVQLQNGMAILAHGRVAFYEAGGACQLYVDLLEQQGIGLLYLQLEQVKRRLESEGLFDRARKRSLPTRPDCIGIVTSPTGAVLHDILHVLQRRSPWVRLLVAPTTVQGRDAAPNICRALALLNECDDVEVIIVARGGGSIEDLWGFNEESVAYAVAQSRVPVVSGVGHETDFTICDMVADVRAATPSVAAELVAPSIDADYALLHTYEAALERAFGDQLERARTELARRLLELDRRSPRTRLAGHRQRIDDMLGSLAFRMQTRLARAQDELEHRSRQLGLVDPRQVLQRGYAIVRDPSTGGVVSSTHDALPEMRLDVQLRDGHVPVTVAAERR